MSKIIIDNWTLQRAAVNINNTYEGIEFPSQDYAALIEAIILWDDVCYFENEYSQFWQDILWRFQYGAYLRKLPNALPDNSSLGVVDGGALAYFDACKKIGANYLLTEERMGALQRMPVHTASNRMDVFKQVDARINQHYELFNKQIGKDLWKFRFPALFDFVKNNTENSRFYVKTALEYRNSFPAKAFRAWLNNLDSDLSSSNPINATKHILELTNIIDKMASQINDSRPIEISIGFPFNVTTSLSHTFSLNHPISLLFFRRLVNDSFYNRTTEG